MPGEPTIGGALSLSVAPALVAPNADFSATITDTSGKTIDLDQLRDDMSGPAGSASGSTQMDDDGRPYHLHDDGAVHYLDED